MSAAGTAYEVLRIVGARYGESVVDVGGIQSFATYNFFAPRDGGSQLVDL